MKAETIMSRMRPLLLILSSIAFLLMIVALVSGTTITASAAAQPNAPSNTNAVAVSDSQVNVSWQDNSPNETGFEIHRSTNGPSGAFTLIATTTASAISRADTGLNPSTQYCYKVRAFKKADGHTTYSNFSNAACAIRTPSAPPIRSWRSQPSLSGTSPPPRRPPGAPVRYRWIAPGPIRSGMLWARAESICPDA